MFGRKPKQPPIKNVAVGGSQGFGAPFTIQYTQHRQPDPGIAAFSYDVLRLPLYTAIGWGVQNKRQFKSSPSNPVVWQDQAITLTTIGNPGNLAGTFWTTGLIDTTSSPGSLQAPAIAAPGSFELQGAV